MDTEDQRNRGHRELVVQWKSRNRGSANNERKGPEEQWVQRTSGAVGREDQRNSGTVGTEDQWNSGYRGLEEQWAQRTSGTVGTKD